MIIVRFWGGLGNQIFQYVHGRKLAEKANTFLTSDIHAFTSFKDREFGLNRFQIYLRHLPKKVINVLNHPIINHPISNFIYHPLIEERPNQWTEIPKKANLLVKGYWTWNAYFDDFVDEIAKELELKPQFTSKAYLKEKSQVNSVNSVGIHIRRGDYASNTQYNQYFGLTPITYYESAINLIKSKIENPIFYVFSDDQEWVRKNMPFLRNAVFAGELCEHQDFLEFDLLKSCKHQVIANSTFSWWASRLNPNPNKIIVQPNRWYNDEAAQNIYEDKKAFYQPQAIII
ncbi:alpha-1,2-fucosyltransferase [Litoribacter populi]|uniref:alpha-1,2-fucosyltransferase n=1 Tax=Litoribacter populi TaxID=2598460 RepID=UPI00117F4B76|nr:alpha-1,2-fucosyltransferase [Litoribacter populi]